MSQDSNPTAAGHTTLNPSQPLSDEEIERMRIPPDDVDPDSYLRRYTSSKMQLLKATLALVSNRKIVSPPTGPDELYRWTLMNAILFLYDMFPFHRKFFEVMDQEDWNQIFKHFWVLAKVIWYHKYKRWLCREAFNDKPKQLTIKQYHSLRTNPPFSESHFVSCAPALKPTYSTIYVRVIEPFNAAYRLDAPPRESGWYEYYLSPDTPIDTTESGALTPATNPGAARPHETSVWFSQGGAVLDASQVFTRYCLPIPAESIEVQPDRSNASQDVEEQYYALLEFIADPEASLKRRIKEKLGFLSKMERNEIYQQYVERQTEELELDAQRELKGENATDAAAMWEQDEHTAMEQQDEQDEQTATDNDGPVVNNNGNYGYIPAHPVLSETECWDEYWEYYYSLPIRERNLFMEGLAWYAFNLAQHLKWYAIQQEEFAKIDRGEATLDPSAPMFPPNPAAVPGIAEAKPNVQLAFSTLPWGNHFMSTAHLTTMVIYTTRKIVEISSGEARERAEHARDNIRSLGVEEVRRILKELDESFALMGELGDILEKATKVASEAISRGCKAGVFDVDTDELTDYEEMSEVEEWFPPEPEAAPQEAEKKKKKKRNKKKNKGKAKATGDDQTEPEKQDKGKVIATDDQVAAASEKEEEEEEKPKPKKKKKNKKKKNKAKAETEDPAPARPSQPFFDYLPLLAEEEAAQSAAAAYNDFTVPGYDFARVPDAFTASAAGQASLAAADNDRAVAVTGDPWYHDTRVWAAALVDSEGEEEGGERMVAPHARNAVTGREGAARRV